jgi:uncharacterized membrane protein
MSHKIFLPSVGIQAESYYTMAYENFMANLTYGRQMMRRIPQNKN